MTKRLELPKFQAFDSNGDPLSGGLVYTYAAGTTTLKTTYSDYDASTANANPVVLDSRGEADIYLQGSYKIVLQDSVAVTIWTLDNVQGGVGADAAMEDYYYPDATAADQGVTGASNTIKYAVDTISTDNGTIYLKHDGGTATTTYTLTTSESIPENIDIVPENGSILDGAGTLTFDNTSQIVAQPDQQIFGTSLTVVFTNGGTMYPDWWGATGDGSTNDATALQAALDVFEGTSGVFKFNPGKNYVTNTGLTFDPAGSLYSGNLFEGYGAILTSGLTSGYILNITNTSDVQFRNWDIKGLQFYGGASDTGQLLVNAGATGDFHNFSLQDVSVENGYGHAIRLTGNCFECQIVNPRLIGNAANTTGKILWLDETTGNLSSIEIYNASTRYGDYGLYADCGDIDIFGGTFLNAQKEGVYLKNGIGHGVYGLHVENNWDGAANFAAGGGGIYLEGRWSAYGCYGVCGASANQQWVIDTYPAYEVSIFGGYFSDAGSQGVDYLRIKNIAGGNVNVTGVFADDINIASVTANGTDFKIHGRVEETITADSSTLRWFGTSILDSTSNKVDCTLPDAFTIGTIKVIVMSQASNSSIVTVTSHDDVTGLPLATGISGDGEAGTFDAVDETWILMWTGTEWTTLRATCTFV